MMKILSALKTAVISFFMLLMGIALFPLALLALPFEAISHRKTNQEFQRRLEAFKKEWEGSRIFIYSHRRPDRDWVEEALIPHLPENTFVIMHEGAVLHGEVPQEFLKFMLSEQKLIRYPKVTILKNGHLKGISLRRELHLYGQKKLSQEGLRATMEAKWRQVEDK